MLRAGPERGEPSRRRAGHGPGPSWAIKAPLIAAAAGPFKGSCLATGCRRSQRNAVVGQGEGCLGFLDSLAVWICLQEVSRIAVFYRLISKKIKFPFVVKELSPTLKENINKTANTISLSKNCRGVRRSQQSPGSRCPLTSAAPRWPGGPGILLLLLLCLSTLFHAPSRFLARSQRPDRGGTAAFAVCSRGSPWPCPRCSPSEDHPVLCSSLCCTKPGIMIQKHFFSFFQSHRGVEKCLLCSRCYLEIHSPSPFLLSSCTSVPGHCLL